MSNMLLCFGRFGQQPTITARSADLHFITLALETWDYCEIVNLANGEIVGTVTDNEWIM